MGEEARIAELRKHLEELKRRKEAKIVPVEPEEYEGKFVPDESEKYEEKFEGEGVTNTKSKRLGAHPATGQLGKTFSQNEERGFLNIFILIMILILFQVAFVVSLYFLLS